ncbi:CPBP family intramembrane glutamic endopeptidase [Bifidobacterium callitrichidarum]|nr:CPBP family intramembrane glutamic endopeptidase [Bifidobacterium callitrichidarum]
MPQQSYTAPAAPQQQYAASAAQQPSAPYAVPPAGQAVPQSAQPVMPNSTQQYQQYPQYAQYAQPAAPPYRPQPAQPQYRPQYSQYPQYQQQYPYPAYQTYQPYPPRPVTPAPPAIPVDPRQAWRTWRRKVVGRAMGLTFAYEGMMYAGAIIASGIVAMAAATGLFASGRGTYSSSDGIISLISVAVAFGFLLLMRRRDILTREFWLGGPHLDTYGEPNQRGRVSRYGGGRMRPQWFLVFIVLGLGVQGSVSLVQMLLSMGGVDLVSPTSESINESAVTVSMWLYIGLVGPICEEVMFRGVLMKELKPLGKNFAIFTSALAFGLFHDDVVQGTFAFLFGLILGFVAMEYSLVWSIALHIFNNAILSGVIDTLLAGRLSDSGYLMYSIVLALIGVIGSAIVLALYGRSLAQYRRENRSIPDTYAGWTSPAFIAFVVLNAVVAIASLIAAMVG